MRYLVVVLVGLAGLLVGCGGEAAAPQLSVNPGEDAPRISPELYQSEVVQTDHILLDVRTDAEVAEGVIPGARHIELSELASRVDELPADQTIVVYCRTGNRSRGAVNILTTAGRNNLLDLGGILQWQRAGYDLVPMGG